MQTKKTEKTDPDPTRAAGPDMAGALDSFRGQKHAVVLQEFPDPDAIACGYAHQIISADFDIQADIYYCGRISHQQNIALVKLMGIELFRCETSTDLKSYDGAVFLDNQGTTAGSLLDSLEKAGVPPLIIVDHHEPQDRIKAQFKDIRTKIGAASSIYAQYLENGIIELNSSDKNHILMATALAHGIITDTNGFINAREEDFHAAAFLSEYRDRDLLTRIMNQARSTQTMKVIHKALGSREIVQNFCFAGVGYLRAEDRDAIPQAADFLLTEENVHTAIVYGIVTGDNWKEAVIGSMRTNRITIDPDQFIKDVFGKDASGKYFGGGKMSAGGFHIPVGFLSGSGDKQFQQHKWSVFNEQIKLKIFDKIGVKVDEKKEE
ncbi:MAG: bifunctional oligoribonuclease/PAP phosphatase NrnA [Desulfobacterales bacterium]|nr:bifunctional oligoribonuclease/PAP phosphatase NrnA [Desulfobacterales bacterium]